MLDENNYKIDEDNSLLILDDDQPFLKRLSAAMEKRGFDVFPVSSMVEFDGIIKTVCPNYAIVDLRLNDGTGLDAVESIRKKNPDAKVIVLTGYGAIATAVAAVKIGAIDYLSKPADANDILNALIFSDQSKPPPPVNPMSADRVKWEHIQRIFELCNRNVSETARRLNMHRRTLQRILAKRSPKLLLHFLSSSGISPYSPAASFTKKFFNSSDLSIVCIPNSLRVLR